jgi:hypothetical protein
MYNKQEYINGYQNLIKKALSECTDVDLTRFWGVLEADINPLCDRFFDSLINEKQLMVLMDFNYEIPSSLLEAHAAERSRFIAQCVDTLKYRYRDLLCPATRCFPQAVVVPAAQQIGQDVPGATALNPNAKEWDPLKGAPSSRQDVTAQNSELPLEHRAVQSQQQQKEQQKEQQLKQQQVSSFLQLFSFIVRNSSEVGSREPDAVMADRISFRPD